MGFSVLFLSIGKIKMQQVWKGQTVSPLILCMTSEIIKKLRWDNWYETWDTVITKLGSICAHAGEASSHFTPENIFFLILHFMDILNCLFLMIVLTDVHQYCVITQRNRQPEGTQSVNYNHTEYRRWAICDSRILNTTLLFHSSTSTFELVKAADRQHVALSQTCCLPLSLFLWAGQSCDEGLAASVHLHPAFD